jgi:Uma2 family endonuclease
MATHPKNFITPEQYLEIERKAEFKSEYYQGEMFAMAGARPDHNLIVTSLIAHLYPQLRSRPCLVYQSDQRVRVSDSGLCTYPDVVVVCDEPQFVDDERDTLTNPTLIVEVLSPSTEAYDRGRKFDHYRSLPSLREYLLVASDRVHADLYTRQSGEQWLLTAAGRPEDTIKLSSIACQLTLAEIYEQTKLTETGKTV